MFPSPLHTQLSRRSRAFSLTEILVAIGIICTLFALGLGSWKGVQQAAENAKCMANLRQIGVGILQYSQENSMTTPRLDHQIVEDLYPYLYPQASTIPVISGVDFPAELRKTVFLCPSMKRDVGATSKRSYGYNAPLIQHSENPSENQTGTKSPRFRLPILEQPSKVMLYGDTWSQSAIQFSRIAKISERHNGRLTMLMADAHVESIPLNDTSLQNVNSMLWKGK